MNGRWRDGDISADAFGTYPQREGSGESVLLPQFIGDTFPQLNIRGGNVVLVP